MNPDLVAQKIEEKEGRELSGDKAEKHTKRVTHLIAYFVRERVGVFAALVIMNAWSVNPDLYRALLRRASPIIKNQEINVTTP